jgi:hypothetical protein
MAQTAIILPIRETGDPEVTIIPGKVIFWGFLETLAEGLGAL